MGKFEKVEGSEIGHARAHAHTHTHTHTHTHKEENVFPFLMLWVCQTGT